MISIPGSQQQADIGAPPTAAHEPPLPWWLRGGVGALIAVVAAAVVWVTAWEVAAAVASTPGPPDRERPGPSAGATPAVAMLEPAEAERSPTPATASVSDSPSTSRSVTAPAELPSAAVRSDPGPETVTAARAALRRERRAGRELAALARTLSVPLSVPLSAWTSPLAAGYRITARFGASGSNWKTTHTGLDLAIASGTPVRSAGHGTVTFAGEDGAYGLKVEVTHPDGTESWYAHLSRIDVVEGTTVTAGATLGAVGATGNVTGPHLHLEVRPYGGDPVDPVTALGARGIAVG